MRALVLLPVLAACNGTLESFFAQDVVDEDLDLAYVDHGDARQRLDLYTPRELTGFPVVVFVHGGFWVHQDKDYFQPIVGLYRNVGIALARRGIGTAVIDYRLIPDVSFDDQLADVAHAITWVHDHAAEHGGDPTRLVIAGHSAGGHIAALAAFDDARLAADGVDLTAIRGYAPLSPIVDLAQMAASSPGNADMAAQVFGDDLVTDSPSSYLHAGIAPTMILLGERDLDFLLVQVPPVIATLQALGAPIELHQLAGDTHDDVVLDFDGDDDEATPLLADFVARVAP